MDEDLSKIQVEFRAQRGMLQALHDTQSEHSAMLREHSAALTGLRTGQAQLRREMTEVRVGIGTIIGLLTPPDGDEESGGTLPE
jgi:hypothetical protein